MSDRLLQILSRVQKHVGLGRHARKHVAASNEYQILSSGRAVTNGRDGWHLRDVVRRQDDAYRLLIEEMHKGNPRVDLQVAADAVLLTGIKSPSILEVGCGSGYYCEVLNYLLENETEYTGLDYSREMIRHARKKYPEHRFVIGNAALLPFDDQEFDVVLDGVALMHISEYRQAIQESVRVARSWCIFHTVPLVQRRPTTHLQKRAYGLPTLEILFNETTIRSEFDAAGLVVEHVLPSISYDLESVVHEPTTTKTFVCRKA